MKFQIITFRDNAILSKSLAINYTSFALKEGEKTLYLIVKGHLLVFLYNVVRSPPSLFRTNTAKNAILSSNREIFVIFVQTSS